jgi:hypothetical protein
VLAWACLGAAIGAGVLLKHTAVLLAAGGAVAAIASARRLRWGREGVGAAVAMASFVAVASPMLWGEWASGFATVRHLMGHVGLAGGDVAVRAEAAGGRSTWGTIGSGLASVGLYGLMQLAIVGPGLVVLMVIGSRGDGRDRACDRAAVFGRLMLAAGALPLVMYLGVAWVTEVEANWPVAGYVTLVVLAGRALPARLAAWRRSVRAWEGMPADERPKRGWLRKKPETAGQMMWHWALAYGLGAAVVLTAGGWLLAVPAVGERVPGAGRVIGHAAAADRLDALWPVPWSVEHDDALADADRPIVMASTYGDTALLAFYLEGRPTVYCGQAALAGRRSAYDTLPGTDLDAASLHGRDVLLFGATAKRWGDVLELASIEEVTDDVWAEPSGGADEKLVRPTVNRASQLWGKAVFVGRDYRGLSEVGARNRRRIAGSQSAGEGVASQTSDPAGEGGAE